MKKKDNLALLASLAFASIGIGTMAYSYAKMHPLKAKKVANDMKNMMKDLK